jgi:hypothetical protein
MVLHWWPAFAAAGFVQSDFVGTIQRIITAAETPRWPNEHLGAIKRELFAARDRRARAALVKTEPGATGPRCPLCEWTGWVLVPHPSCVAGGQWLPPFRTGTVACTKCGPGQRAYDANCMAKDAKRPTTLETYEWRVNPAWREQMAAREEAVRLMHRAEDAAASFSPSFPRLAQAIAAGTYKPPAPRRAS